MVSWRFDGFFDLSDFLPAFGLFFFERFEFFFFLEIPHELVFFLQLFLFFQILQILFVLFERPTSID